MPICSDLKSDPLLLGSDTQVHGGAEMKFLNWVERNGLWGMGALFLVSLASFVAALTGQDLGMWPTAGIVMATLFALLYAFSTRVRSN